MLNRRLLVLLTILIFTAAIWLILTRSVAEYDAMGSLFGAVGSLLAVVWFSASLFYQSVQLREQRQQFIEEFQHLREDARRNALIAVRDILRDAEESVLKANPALKSIADLSTNYVDIRDMQTTIESRDPTEVRAASTRWLATRENPAMGVMSALKNAPEVYFRALGESDVDYSKDPEDFIRAYGQRLWRFPYFDKYSGTAGMLAEFMSRMQPGRKAAALAALLAITITSPRGIMKSETIMEDLEQREKEGGVIPAIAEIFRREFSARS